MGSISDSSRSGSRGVMVLVLLFWMCGLSCCQEEVMEVTKALLDDRGVDGVKEKDDHVKDKEEGHVHYELKKAEDEYVSGLLEAFAKQTQVEKMFNEARLNEKLYPLEEGGPEVVVDSLYICEEEIPRRSVFAIAFRRLLEDGALKALYEGGNARSLVTISRAFAKCTHCAKVSSVTRWEPKLKELTAPDDIKRVQTFLHNRDFTCKSLVEKVVKMLVAKLVETQGGIFFSDDGTCMVSFVMVPAISDAIANPLYVAKIKHHFFPLMSPKLRSQSKIGVM